MYEFFNELSSRAPELFFGVLFITALWVVLREYRRIGAGIKEGVQTEVAAQLGRTMGDLRISAEEARRAREDIQNLHEEVRKASLEFDTRVSAQEKDLNELFSQLKERVAKYERSLPDEEQDTKIPASQLSHAIQRSESWAEASGLVDTLAEDPDATALDLELAGDRSRNFGQFGRALELYDLSRQKDPERKTVAIEYLALKAQESFEERDEALEEAIALVQADPQTGILARLTDTLISLGRYGQMRELCEGVIGAAEGSRDVGLLGLCHKNLGTALRELNEADRAAEEFRLAYEMDPGNENFLKGYAHYLLEEGDLDGALPLFAELVHMDPLDGSYFFYLGGVLEKVGREEEAFQAYLAAEKNMPDGPLKDQARRAAQRLVLLDELPPFIKELRGQGSSEEDGDDTQYAI